MNMKDVSEVVKLLDGHYEVEPEARSYMDPEPEPLPTSVHNVMQKHIYQDAGNKPFFQQALKVLISGNASEVYLAFAYFEECLLLERYYKVSFQIDRDAFVPLLQKAILKNVNELAGTIVFWNGVMAKGCLDRIKSASDAHLKQYGFYLLQQSPDALLTITDQDAANRVKFHIERGDIAAARDMFDLSEQKCQLTEDMMIKVERIKGKLVLVGAQDDSLWDICRYIDRMIERLKVTPHACRVAKMTYQYGSHFVFPQSMLEIVIPVGSSFLLRFAFRTLKDHPKECKQTRIDIDRRLRRIIQHW